MEKLAGDLLLGLKFVKLEILSTLLIDFLYDKLEEFKVRIFGPERVNLPSKQNEYIHIKH